jgi:hypothetical protein
LANGAAVLSIGLGLSHAVPSATPGSVSCLIATCLLAMNAAGLWLCREEFDRVPPRTLLLAGLGCTIGPVLAGFAWNPAGAVFPAAWSTLLLLASASGLIVWLSVNGESAASATDHNEVTGNIEERAAASVSADGLGTASASLQSSPREIVPAAPLATDDPTVSLQMTRRAAGGGETIEITTRLTFLPGERQVSVHLPIAPPLASVPEVECEPVEASDVELSIGAVYAYGVRIDAKRPLPVDAPLATTIAILLRAALAERAAA